MNGGIRKGQCNMNELIFLTNKEGRIRMTGGCRMWMILDWMCKVGNLLCIDFAQPCFKDFLVVREAVVGCSFHLPFVSSWKAKKLVLNCYCMIFSQPNQRPFLYYLLRFSSSCFLLFL